VYPKMTEENGLLFL